MGSAIAGATGARASFVVDRRHVMRVRALGGECCCDMSARSDLAPTLVAPSVEDEAVADPKLRLQESRTHRIVLQLASEVRDVHAQVRLRVAEYAPLPDHVEQVSVREHASGIPRERREQVELGGGQVDALAALSHRARRQVDRQITGLDHRTVESCAAAERARGAGARASAPAARAARTAW